MKQAEVDPFSERELRPESHQADRTEQFGKNRNSQDGQHKAADVTALAGLQHLAECDALPDLHRSSKSCCEEGTKGQDAQSADLEQKHDNGVPRTAPVGSGRNHDQARNATGTG